MCLEGILPLIWLRFEPRRGFRFFGVTDRYEVVRSACLGESATKQRVPIVKANLLCVDTVFAHPLSLAPAQI